MQVGKYDITLDDIAYLPTKFRLGIIALTMVVLLALVYWFDTRGQVSQIEQLEKQELQLKTQFSGFVQQSVNSKAYQEQIARLQEQVNGFISQLPDQTELPDLLENITRISQQSQITLTQMQPQKLRNDNLYRVLPITINAQGSYHQLATFISRLENMPTIVLLGNWQMHLQTASTSQERVDMTMTVNSIRHQHATKRLAGRIA